MDAHVTVGVVLDRLHAVRIPADEYERITKAIDTLTEEKAQAILAYLELWEEWPDGEWELPDFVLSELREQVELDRYMAAGAEIMSDEKLKSLWDKLNIAHKIEAKFIEQHETAPSEFTRTLALSLWIEENRGEGRSQPKGGSNVAAPDCPACGGKMFDNRGNKKNAKAPDFRCKDENCTDENGYRTALWERDLGKKQPPKKVVQKRETVPAEDDDPDDPLPF